MLVRNKREQGGPGKLRSFWEEDVFSVVERKNNGVVYDVVNLSKSSDRRILHRNMLMPCDMMEDIPPHVPARLPRKQTVPRTRQRGTNQLSLEESNSSSDEEGFLIDLRPPTQPTHRDDQLATAANQSSQNFAVEPDRIIETVEDRIQEEEEEVNTLTDQRSVEDIVEEVGSEVQKDITEPEELETFQSGRSQRVRKPRSVLTYYKTGGDPFQVNTEALKIIKPTPKPRPKAHPLKNPTPKLNPRADSFKMPTSYPTRQWLNKPTPKPRPLSESQKQELKNHRRQLVMSLIQSLFELWE